MKTRSDNRELYGQVILFTYPVILVALVGLGWLVSDVFRGGAAWNLIYGLAVSSVVLGAVNIVRGKWPKYRAGEFGSFGVRGLPAREGKIYRRGWKLVMAGSFSVLLLLWLL